MNAWAVIVVAGLAGMLATGAISAAAARRADFALGMGLAAAVLALALAGYVNGLRAIVYDQASVAAVRIVTPKRITDRVPTAPAAVQRP